jgi:hypothetical protein
LSNTHAIEQTSVMRSPKLLSLAIALGLLVRPIGAQEPAKPSLIPVVRVSLQIDSLSSAQFDARDFDLSTMQSMTAGSAAEIRLVKRAGPHTGVLLGLSVSGTRVPSAVVDVLDSLGASAVSFRLSDVTVTSDRLSLSSARANLEQQRISQQEALSALTADFQEAQRQLVTIEELNKMRGATRSDLARARDRASDLQRRIDLLKQRQALLVRQVNEQGPLDETVVLRFGRFEIDSHEPGGRAAIDVQSRSRDLKSR